MAIKHFAISSVYSVGFMRRVVEL